MGLNQALAHQSLFGSTPVNKIYRVGPRTVEDRQRCAEAKTIHGNEARKARTERGESMRRLSALEDLGYAVGIMSDPRTPGKKFNMAMQPNEAALNNSEK